MKALLFLFFFISASEEAQKSIKQEQVIGIYNNWEMNWQLRIYKNQKLEFFTPTCATPYEGSWSLNGKNIIIKIPTFVEKDLKFKVKKLGFYNESGNLVWDKTE